MGRSGTSPMDEGGYRLSACLELLFVAEAPDSVTERVVRSAAAGISSVEIWFWRDKDLDALGKALRSEDVELYAMMSEPMARLVDPSTHENFVAGVERSARIAADLGCPNLMVFSGATLPSVPRRVQYEAIVDALRRAAPLAEAQGVTLALESLNSRIDHVGNFLDRTEEALAVVREVESPNVTLLYDLYHSVTMGESAEEVLEGNLESVGHVQVADVPGRHEPGTGTIDWPAFLTWLSDSGYKGRIGLEYEPVGSTTESLAYLRSKLAGIPSPDGELTATT